MSDHVAHYRILDRIGCGGLGELYRARDTKLGRTVALRILPDSIVGDPGRLGDLLRAAEAAAALSHPNIAALFDCGAEGRRRYLAFEFVPGQALRAKLRAGPGDVRWAIDFGVNLADALAHAETHEVGHGDIRPETIVVTHKDRPKFLDFGFSGFTGRASRGERAPSAEAEVEKEPARRAALADIHALGMVIDEMLGGPQHAAARPEGPATSPRSKAVPAELRAVVRRMLSPDAATRYQTAATIAAELRVVAAILDVRWGAAAV